MLKVAHYSDLHASQKTKVEALATLAFIFEECRKREVHALINSGDTFDGPITLGNSGPLNELLDLFFSKVQCPHYVIEGTKSHDMPGSIDIFEKLRGFGKTIHVHRLPASYPLVKTGHEQTLLLPEIHPAWNLDPGDGTPCGHISFLPAPTKSFLAEDFQGSSEDLNQYLAQKLRTILADFGAKAAESPKPHILVSHITVAGSELSTGQVMLGGDIQVSVADLALANADYVALGHIHKAQKLGSNIYYAGSPYHLNFGELEPKGFNIVTFDDGGNLDDVGFVRTPSRPRQVIDAEIAEGHLKLLETPCAGADIRIRIYAPQHGYFEGLDLEAQSMCAEANSLKIEFIPTAENRIRAVDLSKAKTLRDKLVEYGNVKSIDIAETVLQKADQLEEEVAA